MTLRAIVRRAGLCLLVACVGCGAEATSRRAPETPTAATSGSSASAAGSRPTERAELENVSLAAAPTDAPIALQRARIACGASLALDDTSLDETIVLVLEGALEASPRLAGGHDAPVPLAVGSAIRIPPGTSAGTLRASCPGAARVLIARARCGSAVPCAPATGADVRGQLALLGSSPELVVAQGQVRVRILFPLVASETTALSLARLEIRRDATVPRHVHEGSAEILVIESGAGTLHLGDEQSGVRDLALRAGMGVYVPPNTPHAFACTEALSAWQLYGPSGPEMRFRAAAAPDAGR